MRYIFILLFAGLLHSCTAQQKQSKAVVSNLPVNADDNTLLWEISGNGIDTPSHLFGTFHLMCREDIHFSENLKTAIKNSDEVYFEMDLDDPANTLGAMFYMNMKDGKKLKDLYTEAEYKRIITFFEDSMQLPSMLLQRMKPTFLEAFLYPAMMPCKTMSGVEEELMKIAKADKKEIKGFETIAFQASVFDSIPYDVQAKSLLKTIDSLPLYRLNFDTMLNVYKSQQLGKIEKLFNGSDLTQEENLDVMLYNRNKNWVSQLKTILKKENIFMAVGAGHLVGSQGLIELLRKEGYTVRPIKN
ncbi:TraB/GumN family protein [Ferruginibacter sp. HRS2-29]|uniref:TraB/GumN family protein n=1 Tax=Ferruginibacter sp. HRS2-29 TaxID=2487334 RepID=UPI0020CD1EEF|nr:TraB/GumN family protein [Ferruginibacter sp. HRS2-29]MCP9751350.1 TraB/GumN family protein [Ferruginibacter sp. HRS2-29]